VIIFGSVRFLSKKSNQIGFFKKIQNQTETGSNRPVLVQFAYFRTKTGFFPTWLGFFWFGFDSVRFFQFQGYKTEPNCLVFIKF
jgi:hypothetical protein